MTGPIVLWRGDPGPLCFIAGSLARLGLSGEQRIERFVRSPGRKRDRSPGFLVALSCGQIPGWFGSFDIATSYRRRDGDGVTNSYLRGPWGIGCTAWTGSSFHFVPAYALGH